MLGIEPNYGQHVVARIIPSRVFPGIEDMITPDVLRSAIALNQNFSITIANQTITIPPDQQYNFLYQAVRNALINGIDLDFTVVDSIDDPVGKYPSALGNLIMADSTYLLRSISESVSRAIGAQVNLNGLGIRLTDYAFTTVIKLNNRITTYTRNEKERNRLLIEDSNRIALKLGPLVNCKWTFPISLALQASAFVRLFLDQLFNIVLALLVILGSLLIYSLLLNNIDEKTYEYGMLRALGLSARSLLIIMVAYSLMFSIPGVGLGLFVAFLVNIPVSILIGQFSATDPDYELNPIAIGLGVGIGLLIPLLTNIIPISRAFSKSLRDALDVSHRTFSETSVAVQRLEALGIDPLDTAIGITLIVFGVVAYYLIPYSFTFNDMPLFFTILNAILLGMLLGLCLLCQPFEVYLERGFLYFFTRILIRRERNLHNLIKKNMTGHRPRTKKTALMFTIALAFLIFCGVIFSLQAKSIPMAIESLLGSDIVVKARTNKVPLDPSRLSSFLNRWDTKAKIRDYSFATFEAKAARLSNLVGFPRLRTRIIGIDPDKYLRSTYDSYFLVTEERTSDVDFGKGYIPPLAIRSADPARTNLTQELDEAYIRSVTAVISEATRDYMSLDTETPLRENVASSSADDPLRETSESRTYLGVAKQMVKKAPGIFGFSRFAITVFLAPQLVSLDDYSFMTKKTTDFQTCFVRINDLSTNERIDLINAIRNYVDQDNTDVTDVIATVQSTKVATDAILLFFNIVAVITTLLCFLILWLSFIANVKENSWEFGVLRSLGLGVWALIRTYIYEALCLILSSVVLGSIIGLIIALTLSAQFNLFLELPFVFDFPFALFFSVFGMSIVVAFVGSYLPARKLKDQEIAYVIRGL
jgi:ABC-type antimicrobial peptide transport system permease subunit